jgi:hypothetical protein
VSETHGCEICNKRAIVGLQERWYCPEHIDEGMKILAKPLKRAIWRRRERGSDEPRTAGQR